MKKMELRQRERLKGGSAGRRSERSDGKLSEVVCKSGDWIEIPPDSMCIRAAAIALGGSAEGYVAIDHPNIVHSRYLPTDACLRSIRAGMH